jgi:hypothetical protein
MTNDNDQPYRTHTDFNLNGTDDVPPSSIIADAMKALHFSDERIKNIAPRLDIMAKEVAAGTFRGELRTKLMPLAGVTEANVSTLVEAVKQRAAELHKQAVGSITFGR